MVFKDNNVQQSTFVLKKLDDRIPEDHMCLFIKKFVLKEFKYLDDKNYKKMGRASYRPTSLLALLVFANYEGIDNYSKISEYCIYNILYKYVYDDIQPSERTLQRFIKKTRPIIN